MSEKQVKVAKPEKAKPQPVKPDTPKTVPIKPIKAEHNTCVRCSVKLTPKTGCWRQLCSPCDLALQGMHWNLEHQLFRRTIYIPKVPHDDGPPLKWLMSNGYAEHLRKPPRPYIRSIFPETTGPTLSRPSFRPGLRSKPSLEALHV